MEGKNICTSLQHSRDISPVRKGLQERLVAAKQHISAGLRMRDTHVENFKKENAGLGMECIQSKESTSRNQAAPLRASTRVVPNIPSGELILPEDATQLKLLYGVEYVLIV